MSLIFQESHQEISVRIRPGGGHGCSELAVVCFMAQHVANCYGGFPQVGLGPELPSGCECFQLCRATWRWRSGHGWVVWWLFQKISLKVWRDLTGNHCTCYRTLGLTRKTTWARYFWKDIAKYHAGLSFQLEQDMVERLREHLLLEEVYSGGVCLLPELKAKLEDHGISSKCRLTIEVGAMDGSGGLWLNGWRMVEPDHGWELRPPGDSSWTSSVTRWLARDHHCREQRRLSDEKMAATSGPPRPFADVSDERFSWVAGETLFFLPPIVDCCRTFGTSCTIIRIGKASTFVFATPAASHPSHSSKGFWTSIDRSKLGEWPTLKPLQHSHLIMLKLADQKSMVVKHCRTRVQDLKPRNNCHWDTALIYRLQPLSSFHPEGME